MKSATSIKLLLLTIAAHYTLAAKELVYMTRNSVGIMKFTFPITATLTPISMQLTNKLIDFELLTERISKQQVSFRTTQLQRFVGGEILYGKLQLQENPALQASTIDFELTLGEHVQNQHFHIDVPLLSEHLESLEQPTAAGRGDKKCLLLHTLMKVVPRNPMETIRDFIVNKLQLSNLEYQLKQAAYKNTSLHFQMLDINDAEDVMKQAALLLKSDKFILQWESCKQLDPTEGY